VLCLGAGVILLNMASLSPLLKAIGEEFGTSDAVTGQLSTVSALVIVVASLVATPWMDRWSRRTWLRLEGLLLLIGLLVSAAAPTFGWLIVGRIISAAGAAVIMANCLTGARELFHDATWRNRAIGLIISATTLAIILGLPIITQLGEHFGWRVALASIGLPVALLLAGTAFLPTSPRQDVLPARPQHLEPFRAVLGNGRTRWLLVMMGLNLGIYTGWLVYFGAYATEVFAITAGTLSTLFFLSGLTEFAANNVTPPLLRRFDAIHVAAVALAIAGAALLLTGIVITTIPGALLAAVLVLNGTAAAYVAGTSLLLNGEVSHPGAAMALTSASTGIGNALGPFIAGWALATSGSFEMAYRVLGLFAPVAIVALWLATRRSQPLQVLERSQSTLG
jgi:DHA1 family inner membrane transport protein